MFKFIIKFKLDTFKLNSLKKIISFIIIFEFFVLIKYSNKNLLTFDNYVRYCTSFEKTTFKRMHNRNIENYYISICIPIHNMEKYIKIALISIIRQTFQNFEIILVNDDSNDNTINIINEFQSRDNRIYIINHAKNFGVYASRRDAILNSKGNYILLLDPDDMLLNKELFQKLYNYNTNLNLDIIEFLVFHRLDNEKKLIIPKNHQIIHAHNFQKKIIYQPELSDILFKKPNTNKYSSIICRPIWNK